jgi:hypothetical protein
MWSIPHWAYFLAAMVASLGVFLATAVRAIDEQDFVEPAEAPHSPDAD